MAITIGSNFNLATQLPLDSRVVKADLTARDAIASGIRFDGLTVYVISELTSYQLQGGIDNTDWVDLSTIGGTTPTDGILDWVTDKYQPYSVQTGGSFYSGTTDPTSGTRLNYDGNFHATQLYAVGITVSSLTSGSLVASSGGSQITVGNNAIIGGGTLAVMTVQGANGSTGGTLDIRGGQAEGVSANGGNLRLLGGAHNGGTHGKIIMGNYTSSFVPLPNTVTANSLYYNTTTGEVTYGAAGAGSSQWTTTGSDIYFANKVTIGSTKAPDTSLYVDGVAPWITLAMNGVNKTYIGVSGGASQLIQDSIAGDFGIRSNGYKMLFSTDSGTTAHMVISTTGNIGIGTAAPTSLLHLVAPYTGGYSTFLKMGYDSSESYVYSLRRSGSTGYLEFTGTQAGAIGYTFNGNVGIGTTDASGKRLKVVGNTWLIGQTAIGQNTSGTAIIDAYDGYAFYGCNSPTNGIRISSAGTVTIQSSGNAYNENLRLRPSSANGWSCIALGTDTSDSGTTTGQWSIAKAPAANSYYLTFDYAGGNKMVLTSGGSVIIGGATSSSYTFEVSGTIYASGNITGNSDIRYKTVLGKESGIWDKGYADLDIIRFKYNDVPQETGELIGYSAQNLQTYFPECISTDDSGRLGIKMLPVIALNTLAIQELRKELLELKEELRQLKSKLTDM